MQERILKCDTTLKPEMDVSISGDPYYKSEYSGREQLANTRASQKVRSRIFFNKENNTIGSENLHRMKGSDGSWTSSVERIFQLNKLN